jgi:molybdopterin converting factor small subunit
MKVTVQFFGEFRRVTGLGHWELELEEPARISEVLEAVRNKFPILRKYARSTLISRGLEFAEPTEEVRDGDEISLMPPVAGG